MKLVNKVGIITGAGSGIGRGIAFLFAKEGAIIVVVDIDSEGGKETVAYIRKNGGKAAALNAGLQQAKGDIILFSDSDSFLDSPAVGGKKRAL